MTILTFSHLRWDFVYQRPQHLLSRLAAKHRVIFIEEPVGDSGPPRWQRMQPEKNVTVLRPHSPVYESGYHDAQLPVLRQLLRQLLQQEDLGEYVVWFYTPLALPVLDVLQPKSIIYDCMDELSAFRFAPPQLLEREATLLQLADVVFTGGPSLYRAKKHRHPNVHCFASSVDAEHFGSAKHIVEASDQAGLRRPRLGYYGVIDERIDLDVLDELGKSRPEWEIVMVGPVVKIEPEILPRHPNLHYLGQRSYGDLPGYLAGWDVCLLPFAMNEATRFISPTKTLEYMAAQKVMVSTPITDVVEPYSHIAWIADTPQKFVSACDHALNVSDEERAVRTAAMKEVLAQTSWDKTAADMERAIMQSIAKRAAARAAKHPETIPALVAGAGPTGLSAAYHLGEDSILVEQNSGVGGWCRSIKLDGFTFDYAGHIMFSNEPYVHQLYKMLLGDNVHWQDRESWIYSKNVFTRYPFQGALYGLPPEVITECLVGAIEARFGPLKEKHSLCTPPAPTGTRANGKKNGRSSTCSTKGAVQDCCADGILESSVKLLEKDAAGVHASHEPRNFEEFIYKVWGAGIAKHFAIPYNRKLWAVPLSEMETSWLGGRVPLPDLQEMIEGALKPVPKPMGPNARFGYPLKGGFQALIDGFLPHLRGELRLNTRITGISAKRRIATFENGRQVRYDALVSTLPLPTLVRMIGEEAPANVRAAAAALRHVSVRCVHLGIGRENLTEKHWIYYPEDTVFHRIFVQGNTSPHCNPPGGFGLTCEITYSPHKPLPCEGDDLIQRCIEDCRKVGLFKESDPVWTATQVDLPYAYVVYDHGRKESVELIREWVSEHDIVLAGRYSEWEYYNSDHAFIAGKKAAEEVRERIPQKAIARVLPAGMQFQSAQGD